MYKHILFPTDGSELSKKAAKQAISLAKGLGARITAINVKPQSQPFLDEGFVVPTMTSESLRAQFKEQTGILSNQVLEAVKAAAEKVGVACDVESATGDSPYEEIIKQALKSKCDLIMMASHGRKGLQGLLLGSETAKVLTHSKVPVLVVR